MIQENKEKKDKKLSIKDWKNYNNLDLSSYDPLITNFKIYSHDLFTPDSIFNTRKAKDPVLERLVRRERNDTELANFNKLSDAELKKIDFNIRRINKKKKDPPMYGDYPS